MAAVASLAFAGLALVPVSGAASAAAADTAFARLCAAFGGEYRPAAVPGASPTCRDDHNITLDHYGDAVNHTMFFAACWAMGYDGIDQTGSDAAGWVLFCE
jgi:hypothetical protein